jgi:hypothetical protein
VTTRATKYFADARRLIDVAERKIKIGDPVGPPLYLLRLVIEDIEQLGKK